MPIWFDLSALYSRRSAKSVLALLAAVAVISLVTFNARVWRNKKVYALRQDPAATTLLANTSQEPKAEVVLLVLTPKGFDQDMITRPTGKFLLVVESRLGLKEPSLTLSRIVGNKSREDGNNSKEILKGGNIKKEQRNWSEELNLNPGEYELTEVNNPDWSCKLVITPN